MKNLLIIIVLVSAALTPFTASANVTTEWQPNESNDGYVIDSYGAYRNTVILLKSQGNTLNVYFTAKRNECTQFESNSVNWAVLTVNKQAVQFNVQCQGYGTGYVFPTSEAGRYYVYNQLRINNVVAFTDASGATLYVSGKGFVQASNTLAKNLSVL